MISAIVLAAGLARRFGAAKPLALYQGKPLVRHVVNRLERAGVHEIVVMVSQPDRAYMAALDGVRTSTRVVLVDHPEMGMSRSLYIGISVLDPRTEAMIVALADQPTIQRTVVRSLVREWQATRSHIVAPVYRGERGHPVLFDAVVFPELYAITGDRGAREVVERDASRVRLVQIDADVPKDVDTPEDLAAL